MSYLGVLKAADIFYKLSPQQIEQIASICDEKVFRLGEMIFEENTTGDELYIIAFDAVNLSVRSRWSIRESGLQAPAAQAQKLGYLSSPERS
jgi:signal-transduction protein with cAMP-binding, CBS, and nucleotidyltransferase domain